MVIFYFFQPSTILPAPLSFLKLLLILIALSLRPVGGLSLLARSDVDISARNCYMGGIGRIEFL